jgi:lipopolysaccharide biosynthesis protein
MFVVKSEYLHKFFGNCNLNTLYEEFEEYYSPNSDLLAHAMERVICYGVEKHKGKFLLLGTE